MLCGHGKQQKTDENVTKINCVTFLQALSFMLHLDTSKLTHGSCKGFFKLYLPIFQIKAEILANNYHLFAYSFI